MCGIYGSIGLNQESLDSIKKIQISMNHRGPDLFKYWHSDSENIFMAHARLSIIDKSSNATQPMIDSLTGNVIVFNGEIYNFRELREELQKLGHIFQSKSDTEVILVGYRQWQLKILDKLVGMFAFGFWDKSNQKLLLARDRMGEKPLYYSRISNNRFVFASEIRTILLHKIISREIDGVSLYHFIKFGYMPCDHTIFKGIDKLEPAHYVEVSSNGITDAKKYWFLDSYFLDKNNKISYEEAIEETYLLLKNAVASQMVADVNLGVYLSGGVDSGVITALMKENSKNVSSFCAGFNMASYDESKEASFVADKLGVMHNSIYMNPLSFSEMIYPYECADEPFSDTSAIPMYYLAKNTREYCTVFLSGDGGDELFGGYETYRADVAYQMVSKLPKSALNSLSKIASRLPISLSKVSMDYKIKKFLGGASKKFEIAHESWREVRDHAEAVELMEQMGYSRNLFANEVECKYWSELPDSHFLDRAMYVDMKTWLPNDILYKVDRMTMAHSIEARAPFLDHRLIEFTASLPVGYKIKKFTLKRMLKDLALIKHNLNYKRKKKNGFSPPISHWLVNYASATREYLKKSNYYENQYIEKLISEHELQKSNNAYKINNLISLAAWKNAVIN
jgi:asparagine synthase (glutamine-hydrolysing)